MNLIKAILLTSGAILVPAVMGQEVEPPEEYRYYVPLPESTYRGGWHFRLELGSRDAEPYQVTLAGYNPIGIPVLNEPPRLLGGDEIFTWQDVASYAGRRLQTLLVITDRPVSGVLWMWDDVYSFINGVSLTAEASDSLILPHIPNDLFSWRTTFVVQGVAKGASFGDIDFQYYDQEGSRYTYLAQGSVGANARITGTPGHDIPLSELGEDTRASWGRVTTPDEAFHLAGYYTFLRNSEIVQSCAMELMSGGYAEGYLGLTKYEDWIFSEGLAFSNPNDEAVTLQLFLTVKRPIEPVEGDDGDIDPDAPTSEVVVIKESVEIPALARAVHALGVTLFKDVDGEMLGLRYHALSVEEYPVKDPEGDEEEILAPIPLPVAAIHLQGTLPSAVEKASAGEVAPLGGHAFVPALGNASLAWMNLGEEFETLIEVFNPSIGTSTIDIVLKNSEGKPVYIIEDLSLAPGTGYHELRSDLLREEILNLNEDLDPASVLRVEIRRKSGAAIHTKVTAFRGKDFAVVNPDLWVIPDEEIEFIQP
jgi:hypothetical protein